MIPRYSRKEMQQIWSEENRFKAMLEVEILAAEAMALAGKIPKSAIPVIRRKAKINIKRINRLEQTVKHDVIAFLTQVGETVGPQARFLHQGMTSSDVLDTALSVQMRQSCDMLLDGVNKLLKTIRSIVNKYKNTPMMGRTHGVHAEPITFGIVAASWYSEMSRAKQLIENTKELISYGKISGAVGTFAHLDPSVERFVCSRLGLKPEPVSTQIVPRDRHASYLAGLAIIGGSIERIATEIRHLQRTEVQEAEEPFTKGQKGSSAMPHKRNPILSENLCGLARLLRGYAATGLENIALWHERDISHSSAERVILPDASIIMDFMLARTNHLLSGLQVYPLNMLRNLEKSQDVIFSGRLLLALVEKGMKREEAYALVQRAAFISRDKGVKFETVVSNDVEITCYLKPADIKESFKLERHFKHLPYVIKRVLASN